MQSKPRISTVTFRQGDIHDVVIRELHKHADERGWLAELFRRDELAAEFHPEMVYISSTRPGFTRGPHAHDSQADFTCFPGPSDFKIRMWDYRPDSSTYLNMMTLYGGQANPLAVLIPSGIVHAYQNVGTVPGLVINCPNRLYRGEGRLEPVDEIRHEDDPDSIFSMDD